MNVKKKKKQYLDSNEFTKTAEKGEKIESDIPPVELFMGVLS